MSRKTRTLLLSLLAAAAVCIHGYHLGTDDGAIYIPAIKQFADPKLYPFGSEFFTTQVHWSILPALVGGISKLIPLSCDWAILTCHFTGVFLLLLAAWQLARVCFDREPARWAAVVVLALTLGVPVAGTALDVMDPYLTARTLSTPALLFALAAQLRGKTGWLVVWLTVAFVLHPQMAAYGIVLAVMTALTKRTGRASTELERSVGYAAGIILLPWPIERPSGIAAAVLASRQYFFVNTWHWYEWLGVLAPLALFCLFAVAKLRATSRAFSWLSRSLPLYGVSASMVAVVFSHTPSLQNYVRLQPMRAFHMLYVVFFIFLGGLLGEYVLNKSVPRWAALILPLAGGMYLLAHCTYPSSAHLEIPGLPTQNPWVDAFLWVRDHTAKDAVFAIDPDYMAANDNHGFRAIAERSVLADRLKDSGPVALFPELAHEWKREVDAGKTLRHPTATKLEELAMRYPVSWAIVRPEDSWTMVCPYRNRSTAVCQLPSGSP